MTEFDLVERIRKAAGARNTAVGIGDDGAVFSVRDRHQVVACCDTLVEGVHFFPGDKAADVGHKALAVNLSDLAAMGAEPCWALLAVSTPADSPGWVAGVADGVLHMADRQQVTLVGGDTTTGPRSVTVTAIGQVPEGGALRRDAASAGELLVLSGRTGEAAWALGQIQQGRTPEPDSLERLRRPLPRVALGRSLVGKAGACIDVSDGLLADLKHVVDASACGADISLESLPVPGCLNGLPQQEQWTLMLGGGDDYELLFSWPPDEEARLAELSRSLALPLTVIGKITAAPAIRCFDAAGVVHDFSGIGYEHFT